MQKPHIRFFLHSILSKRNYFFLFFFLYNFSLELSAQHKIDFQVKSWTEILNLARKENKPIFVDAFTNWCGPCKKMAEDVFSDSSVVPFFNKSFVNYSVNIETQEGKLFDSIFKVSAYPSLLFFEANGELIFREIGYRNVSKFLALGVSAKNNRAFMDFTKKMRTAYENGSANKHLLYKYFLILRDSGRSVDSVAASIISKLVPEDLKNDTAFNIWSDYDQRMDSPLLDYFLEQKQWFITNRSQNDFDHKLNMIVAENLSSSKSSNDLARYENLKTFIRRVYDGDEEQLVLNGVDRKFNSEK